MKHVKIHVNFKLQGVYLMGVKRFKNGLLGQAQWLTPVFPTTREAEAGGLVETGRQRLQ